MLELQPNKVWDLSKGLSQAAVRNMFIRQNSTVNKTWGFLRLDVQTGATLTLDYGKDKVVINDCVADQFLIVYW